MGKYVSTYEKQYQDGNYAAQKEVFKKGIANSEIIPVVRKIHYNAVELTNAFGDLEKEFKAYIQRVKWEGRYQRFFYDPSSLHRYMMKLSPEYSEHQIDRYLKVLNDAKIFTIKDLRYSPQFSMWKGFNLESVSKLQANNKDVIDFLAFMKRFIGSLKFRE